MITLKKRTLFKSTLECLVERRGRHDIHLEPCPALPAAAHCSTDEPLAQFAANQRHRLQARLDANVHLVEQRLAH